MKKAFRYLLLTIAAFLMLLPAFGFSQGRGHGNQNGNSQGWHGRHGNDNWEWRGRRRHQGRNRWTYGYRNYGQYRRTQVGNRRYRLVRRPYWRRGVRIMRWTRIYY